MLSFYSYYVANLMWAVFMRSWTVPVVCLDLVWHYWLYGVIVGESGRDKSEFSHWLPLVGASGALVGWVLSRLVNLRRLIFMKQFDLFGCWLPLALLQFVMLQAVLAVWETTGAFVRPINYVVTFVMYLILLPVWFFLTMGATVWAQPIRESSGEITLIFSDHACGKFYIFWGLFHMSATLIFMVVQWAAPSFWPFWIAIIVIGFHSVMLLMISFFVVNPETSKAILGQQRDALIEYVAKNPMASKVFDFSAIRESSRREEGDRKMKKLRSSRSKRPPSPSKKKKQKPPATPQAPPPV